MENNFSSKIKNCQQVWNTMKHQIVLNWPLPLLIAQFTVKPKVENVLQLSHHNSNDF